MLRFCGLARRRWRDPAGSRSLGLADRDLGGFLGSGEQGRNQNDDPQEDNEVDAQEDASEDEDYGEDEQRLVQGSSQVRAILLVLGFWWWAGGELNSRPFTLRANVRI